MEAITCAGNDDALVKWPGLLTCDWNLFGSLDIYECWQVLMEMRPPISRHLDIAMSIPSRPHPRTGEHVELPVVYSGEYPNLLLFFFQFFGYSGKKGAGKSWASSSIFKMSP